MSLAVIGAGFGRTGTDSMRAALEQLGFGPCHHMRDLLHDPDQERLWRSIAQGSRPGWDHVFEGYNAAVDWPSCYFWRELAEHFGDARIILSVRSAESWYASMEKTIIPFMKKDDPDSVGNVVVKDLTFGGRPDDRAHAMAVYEKHIADIQAAFTEDRLLTYHLGDGWDPLCRFLDKPVPAAEYPRLNASGEAFESLSRSDGD